jgi:hypothetical protein
MSLKKRKRITMQIQEVINESHIDKRIRGILQEKGYKFLAQGADQQAYLAPDGTILKIFGTTGDTLSDNQKSFKAYADYCKENSNNPFLPQFSDWTKFEFDGDLYLQIRMERLFEFKATSNEWADILELIADSAEFDKSKIRKQKFVDDTLRSKQQSAFSELMTHLGEDKFNLLWDTIYDLGKIASKNSWGLDLHRSNFMLGSDGEIVISDPFFAGW